MLPTEMGHGQRNRRSHERYRVDLPVFFSSEMLAFEGFAQLAGVVDNISRGGLFVRSDFLEVPGTPVQLVVTLPRTDPLYLEGQVAWVVHSPPAGPGMGIDLQGDLIDGDTLDDLLAAGKNRPG
jgi:Tfp pilus assembly protein PilZ